MIAELLTVSLCFFLRLLEIKHKKHKIHTKHKVIKISDGYIYYTWIYIYRWFRLSLKRDHLYLDI